MNAQTALRSLSLGCTRVTSGQGESVRALPRMLSADAIKQLLDHGWKIEPVKPTTTPSSRRGNLFYSGARARSNASAKAQGGLAGHEHHRPGEGRQGQGR